MIASAALLIAGPLCGPAWAESGELFGVSAVAKNDVWAVGTTRGAFTEHFDGNSWRKVATPPAPYGHSGLNAVATIAANDVWAVGYEATTKGQGYPYGPLALHWNGTSWSSVPVPLANGSLGYMPIMAVSAAAANDVWAFAEPDFGRAVLHWNGSAWSIVPTPAAPPGEAYALSDVVALGGGQAWVTGYVVPAGAKGNSPQLGSVPLVEEWNGSSWTVVSSFATSSPTRGLGFGRAAIVTGPQDVWVLGISRYKGNASTRIAFIGHITGSAYRSYTFAAISASDPNLVCLSAADAQDIWAAGIGIVGSNGGALGTVRWRGAGWHEFPAPPPAGALADELVGVAAIGHADVWAVGGWYAATGGYQTLIEHWNGAVWQPVDTQ